MTALVASELLKLRTTRARFAYPVVLAAVAGLGTAATIGSAFDEQRGGLKPILRRHRLRANLASQHDLDASKIDLSYRLLLRDPSRSRELLR